MPRVSVITPTFNRPRYLCEAIASSLAQTYGDFEHIVCDDAGPQANRRIVESFADQRLIYIRSATNGGVLQNTLTGLNVAQGEYVAFLFDDDVWEPKFLQRLVPPLDNDPRTVVAFCDHWIIDSEGTIDVAATEGVTREWGRSGLRPGRHHPLADLALVSRAIPIVMGSVIRRNAVDWRAMPHAAARVYDLWIAYALAVTDGAAWYCPERLSRYRVHAGTATASMAGSAEETFRRQYAWCWATFVQDHRLARYRRVLRRRVRDAQMQLAVTLLRQGRTAAARRELRIGWRYADFPSWKLFATTGLALAPGSAARAALEVRKP